MKAAVLHAVGQPMTIEDVALTKPGPREVLIRTSVSGICHSDLHFADGSYMHPMPCVLGHESAGVVEAVGEDVTYVKPGDHVVTCLSVFCGYCEQCITGHPSICSTQSVKLPPGASRRLSWHGGELMHQFLNLSAFAEQMLVHEHALVKIREDMPLDRAALIGCGVLTGVGAVFHTAKVEPGTKVAVIGCGGVGLATINGAALAGAGRILAIDTLPAKLELAKAMGATDTINAAEGAVVKRARSLMGGGVNYSFECLGAKATAEQAFSMLAPGGTATIIGMIPFGTKIELNGVDFLAERKIQGSMMGSNRFRVDMPRLIEFYLQGKLHLDHLISGHIKLDEINEGFGALRSGAAVRNVITFPN
jgi:S-(hydroxymethyl)glutathione dehydrogenase/alcohol dehydrogenase